MTVPNRPRRTTRIASIASSSVLVLPHAGTYVTVILALVAVLLLTVIVGLIFPAVWSRKAPRRRSALEVIRALRWW